jgi:signal transduction histidine kinase/ActR/RegA family two-component response regulator
MGLNGEVTFIEYEQLPIPILCFDKHSKINYLNSQAKEILKKVDASKSNYTNNENEFAIPIWLSIKTQEFIKSDYNEQNQVKRIQVEDAIYFLELMFKKTLDKDNNCQGIKVIIKDVSCYVKSINEMQKKLEEVTNSSEEQLVKLEKANSLTILAAGIAHDFNNILTIILGNIYIIKRYFNISNDKGYNKINNKFSQIERLILQVQDINQQLMSFSKDKLPIKKNIHLKNLIKKTANMVLSGSNNRCSFAIAMDLWPVEVDEGQIREVINNLLINAGQAMPNGGTIQVNATNVYVDKENKNNIKQGKYVMLEIKDKGIGISKEDIDKVFMPYFTTKTNGTGLGLAASYSIIAKHNGYMCVESEVSVGTSFYIYLKASEEEVIIDKVKREKVSLGTGKVLVMDDDKNIREINRLMLMEIGYEVELARNGEEAIKAYKNSILQNNIFDAVIMDLTIRGGMGGKETIVELLELDKKVNAIVASGYSSDSVMNDFKAYGFKGCIKKPYNLEQLASVLNKVVNKTKQLL